ncbi:MAG TPA: radical SAM family heme chaperone HemW, partial [Gammaproteobacteria bacterium]|nr:radical SAM family heme chaperone HemW [Gammaproteobacteria bacterium]
MEVIPLSLYVHLPWCVRKCPYCDFNSHALTDIPETEYVDALIADLEQALPGIWGRTVHSIFLGGGTPSLFSPEAIARLLQEIRIRLRLLPDTEITMEANPGTVEQGRFNGFREAGVNRLSLGVQSFNDTMLKSLGRIHNSLDAHHAIEIARKAGFDNLNLDLMFGLPEQTLQQAREDLAAATGHQPEHLSYYQLTIEPNTLFHHAPPLLPVDDLVWDMQQASIEALDQQGFQRYEVSAYAQEGYTCRHNR